MSIAIILNGISRKKKIFYRSILPALSQQFQVDVFETDYPNHAYQLAAEAVTKKVEIILAAGGDGTLHQVLNGMMSVTDAAPLPVLGVIPLGSGNDFANAMGVASEVSTLIQLIKTNAVEPTDIGSVLCKDVQGIDCQQYFINVCSLGMGPATVKEMQRAPGWLSANGRYLQSIIKVFFTQRAEAIEFKTSTLTWRGRARVLAIANGKSFGHKVYIAPDADPQDGLLNLFLAADVPMVKFLYFLQLLKSGRLIKDTRIVYSTTRKIEITSNNQVALEADGELIGFLPAVVEVCPLQISFLRKQQGEVP